MDRYDFRETDARRFNPSYLTTSSLTMDQPKDTYVTQPSILSKEKQETFGKVETSILSAPRWTKFTKESYFIFKKQLKSYQADRGKALVFSRISEAVKLNIDTEIDDFDQDDCFSA
ncbi:hypothetical protein ADUPG1_010346 [Aduncisulcus paluster]|uniref:Uncharacterized protein n=1 Tax=Aduncisulcus paluster TaxID=2918883 RepID=A0ABQ5JRJ1_9EUKA|nr:hypothetical protein ADUPG1_010346 [Aduncisulcus paluster]